MPHEPRYGIEAEGVSVGGKAIIRTGELKTLLQPEPFAQLAEVIVGPNSDISELTRQLTDRLGRVKGNGVSLGRWAMHSTFSPKITLSKFGGEDPYTQYLLSSQGSDEYSMRKNCVAGVHINYSNGFDDWEFVRVVNALRKKAWMFIALTANSPFSKKMPGGALSLRMAGMRNAYPRMWEDEHDYRHWFVEARGNRTIHESRKHCPMTVCLRLDDDYQFNRVELRVLDGGMRTLESPEVLAGCCQLVNLIAEEELSSGFAKVPLTIDKIRQNDLAAATYGRNAQIEIGGKTRSAKKLLQQQCNTIPSLMEIIRNGSPAERDLRAYRNDPQHFFDSYAGH